MGKSWLVRAFIASLPGDTLVLKGRCYERETVPYKALDNLVDDLCRYLVTLPEAEAEVLIGDDVAALARAFPVLRRVESLLLVVASSEPMPPKWQWAWVPMLLCWTVL